MQGESVNLNRLTPLAPVIRGLLANSTGNQDMPFKPVILKSLTSKEAIDFAASAENAQARRHPAPLLHRFEKQSGGGRMPPLFLDTADFGTEPENLRKQLSDRISEYSQRHSAKPEIICLRNLGIFYVDRKDNDSDLPLKNKVALVTGAAGAIGYGICRGLLEAGCHLAATGLESHHTSQYYVRRKGYKHFLRYQWPKITAVCDTKTHLFFACIVTACPSNDSPEFAPAVIQASRFVKFDSLVADAAYDGEHNHRLCREELGIGETMIPLNRRRGRRWPKSKYRRQMKEHFVKELYKQRSQIESAFSRNKRLLGSALRSRTDQSRERECFLRILTRNLMIIKRAA